MGNAVTIYQPATTSSEYLANANAGFWSDGQTKCFTDPVEFSTRPGKMQAALAAGLYKGWDKPLVEWGFLTAILMYPAPYGYPTPDWQNETLDHYVANVGKSGTVSG